MAVSLVSGEVTLTAVDQLIPGRSLDLAVVRVYRSSTLGEGPLGSAGWHSPLHAHLREIKPSGVVEYHDGTGRVWRFVPHSRSGPPPTHDDDIIGAYFPPKGLYLRLVKRSSGWALYDCNNNSNYFDQQGLMTELSDRHRQGSQTEGKGNVIRFYHNAAGRLTRLVDDLGRGYRFDYFSDQRPESEGGDGVRYGLLKRITDFAGRTIEYEFDDHRRLVKVRLPEVSNPIDQYASYSYVGENRPTITYRYGPAETVTSDDDNTTAVLHGRFAPYRLEGYTLPGSSVLRVRFEYALATGRIKTVAFPAPTDQNTGAASVPWRFEYPSEAGTAAPATSVTVQAPWGQRTEYTLEAGRLEQVARNEVPTLAAADPTPGVTGTIPSATLTTGYAYEDDGRLKSITYPDGGVTRYGHASGGDRLGRLNVATLTRSSGEQDAVTAFSYGPDRVLSGETDPEGRAITYPVAYNGAQPAPTGFTAEGVLSTSTFDTYGRLTKTETAGPDPEVVVYQYGRDRRGVEGGGPLRSVTARGMTETFELDELDLVSKSTTSFGTGTTFTRDDWGRIVAVVAGQSTGTYRAVNATVQRAYDAAGHVVRERRLQTGVGWVETAWTYNEREQVTSVTQTGLAGSEPGDLAEGTTLYSYDSYGRLSTTTSPGQVVTTQSYDSAGRVATVQTAGSGAHRRGYDELGRVVWTTDGDNGSWRGHFDKLGNLTGEQLPSGAFVDREFDLAGGTRRRSVYADSSMAELLAETRYTTTSFGAIGSSEQLVSGGGSPDGTTTTIRSFDGAGRVSEIETTAGDRNRVTVFEYQTTSGLLASSTSALGVRTEYFYENGGQWPGRIVTREPAAGSHPAIVVETSIARDALGRAVRRETAGTVTELILDEAGNVLSSSIGGAYRTEATFDGWGSPVSVRQPAVGGEVHYGYDPDGRLLTTSVARENGQDEVTTYTYDGTGRLSSRTRPGSPTELFSYYPDDTLETWTTRVRSLSGQPLEITYQYDQANRLVARALNREAFDDGERPEGLAKLDFGDSFVYDALGRPLLLAKKKGLDEVDPETAIRYEEYDSRGLPRFE